MKKVSLLIFVSLILLIALASCTLIPGLSKDCTHEWKEATCEAPKTCALCGATEGEALGHDWTAATCATPKTCKTCEATEGEALGHDWKDATCTSPKTCKVCNEQVGSVAAHKNDIVLEAKDPTCTETGLTAGVKCSACGTVTTAQQTLDKLSHTPEVVPGRDSTCTETGLTDGEKCSVCGTTTKEQEVIEKKAHTTEVVPGKAPTCTDTGLTDGEKCSVCGTTTKPQTTIDATGHVKTTSYDAKDPTCDEDGHSAYVLCECGHYVVAKEVYKAYGHDATEEFRTSEGSQAATCDADGWYYMITECMECGKKLSERKVDVPALGHAWGTYAFVDGSAKCGVDGVERANCLNGCGQHDERTAPGTALTHLMPEDAKCDETWNCVHCSQPIEVLAHDYTDPTCVALARCRRCGVETGEFAAHTPGEPVREDVVDSDCTNVGSYNAVVYCTVEGCGHKISTTPTEIPALGHTYAPATCSAPATCIRCPETQGEARTNHDVKAVYADGTLKYVCGSGCDLEFVVDTKYYYDGSDTGFYYNSNGTMPVDTSKGYYEYIFTPDTMEPPTSEDFLAIDNDKNLSNGCKDGSGYVDGWAYNQNNGRIGAQPMFWFPGQSDGNLNFKDFSTANNAVGVVSFNIKTSMTADYTVAIAKPRSAGWTGWGTSSINLLTIGGTEGTTEITIKGGLDGNNKVLTTIPVGADGWTDWFEIKMFIQLLDNGYINVAYYVNDVFGGSFARNMASPDGKNTIDSLDVRALYINGWTFARDTGLALDNIAFGYTTDADYIFDECDHDNKVEVVAPTCLEGGYTLNSCSKCGLVRVTDKVDALGHALATEAAKDSTCLEKGWDEYQYCTRCDYTEKVENDLVDCVGAAPVRENVVNAECGVAGSYEAVVYCSVCGEELSRKTEEIPALEHDYDVVVPGTAATCTAAGLTDGAKCSKCGKEMTAQATIPALGHEIVAIPAVDATCKEDGKTAGEYCARCDYRVEGTVVSKDTVAHTYDNDEDADCNVCGAVRDVACKHDNKEAIPAVDATCTTAGSTAGEKCKDCGEITTAPTTVPATGHTKVKDEAVEPTCTTAGKTEGEHCSVCGEVLTAQTEIAAKGHTEVTDHAVAATCTATGLTEGKHCTVCNVATVPQEVVDALGHDWAAATCDTPKTCKRCGATEGEPVANHTPTASVADGKLTYKCSTCAQSFTTDQMLSYTGNSDSDMLFTFNGDPTVSIVDGAYKVAAGTKKSQYMLYGPSNNKNHADSMTGWNSTNESFGVFAFRIQPGNITEAMRVIIMSARNNPNWDANQLPGSSDAWSGNSVDIFRIDPVGEGTYTLKGATMGSKILATVNGNDWVDVKMFIQINANGQLTVSYYINNEFSTSYSIDLLDPNPKQTIKNLDINNFYMCGWTEAGTGFMIDDINFGYQKNCEWLFDSCDHVKANEATCTAPAKCSCGYVMEPVLPHDLSEATCFSASQCSVCGTVVGDKLSHQLILSAEGNEVAYECSRCERSFAIEHGNIATGDANFNGVSFNGDNDKNFSGAENGSPTVTTDGYYEYIKHTEDSTGPAQVQMWLPKDGPNTVFGKNFNSSNGSIGVLSFSFNSWITEKEFNIQLVNSIYGDNYDVNGDGEAERIRWSADWCITDHVFKVSSVTGGEVIVRGWGEGSGNVALKTFKTNDWTGWFDVAIVLEFDEAKDLIIAHYYIDGEYVATGSRALTTLGNGINSAYLNCNTAAKGSGYKIDNIAFGYTAQAHWMLDTDDHNVTPATCHSPATCTCGWTGNTVENHNISDPTYNASTKSLVYRCTNDGCGLVCDMNGYYYDGSSLIGNFMANGDGFYSGTNKNETVSPEGYGEYIMDNTDNMFNASRGDQYMQWLPDSGHPENMHAFSCENNAVGILAFKINSYTTEALQWKVNTDRGLTSFDWSKNSYAIFTIDGVTSDTQTTVAIKGLKDQALCELELAKDADGNYTKWTGWLDVKMVIRLTDDGMITVEYYINGEHIGDQTTTMYTPQRITSAYCNGYTNALGSGYYLDDAIFAYTDHYTIDGKYHNVTPATCVAAASCSCGWKGTELGNHTLAASNYDATAHTFDYACVNEGCDVHYTMTGAVIDSLSGLATKDEYVQPQKWVPGSRDDELTMFDGFTAENNAYGEVNFSIRHSSTTGGDLRVHVANGRNASTWQGWNVSDIHVLYITIITEGATSATVKAGELGGELLTVSVVDGWTEWIDVRLTLQFNGMNLTVGYYINGTYYGSFTRDCAGDTGRVIKNGHIQTVYFTSETNKANTGWEVKNFVFGYEKPFYNEVIDAANVESETLKTIVASKIKQCDQCTVQNAEGGTPVYVLADGKDGEQVEALYISRSYAWTTETVHFTEFRFAINGEKAGPAVTSISFDYKIKGTVEKNERYEFTDFDGSKFYSDAYVQVKTVNSDADVIENAGDNYPELKGTDLVLDGEWHTFTYEFATPRYLIDFLLNLYHFQGELLIANIEIEYYEPFYNEVIAEADVQSDTLKTIVASKIKQCDQSNPGSDPSVDVFAEGGTPVYVLATGKNGEEVEALYISRTVAWTGKETQQLFTEFRFAINGEKEGPAVTSISFDYKIDGTVEKNERFTFTDFDGTQFSADAYVQVKTINKDADVIENAGDNYPELKGTDLILDGEWHTMTYEFSTPRQLIDFLINLYQFQGEMLIANIQVTTEG